MIKQKEYLVIDGYNIINAWSDLKILAKENLEEARDRLIGEMKEFAAYKGIEVIIVFDAYRVKGGARAEESLGKLKVVYTKEKQTADTYIEKLIWEIGRQRHTMVRVATSDMAEQQIVIGRGGVRISPTELKIEVRDSKKKIKKRIEAPTEKRNTLDSNLSEDVLAKLEALRRGDM